MSGELMIGLLVVLYSAVAVFTARKIAWRMLDADDSEPWWPRLCGTLWGLAWPLSLPTLTLPPTTKERQEALLKREQVVRELERELGIGRKA